MEIMAKKMLIDATHAEETRVVVVEGNKVDEYLIFVASEKDINWLNSYSQIESLKREFTKTNILMENHYSGYMLIK